MGTFLSYGHWIYIGLLGIAIIAYYTKQRFLRPIILLISLVVIGFLQMACASPSGSIQNLFYNWGEWKRVLPFLLTILIVLIPSFFFGKIFCGWVCHKGSVQEFLFQKRFGLKIPHRIDNLLRYFKYIVLAAIVIAPLMFHYRILNSSTQPFKVLFNLGGPLSAVIFMGFIALLSLFIYRPFCRYLCPVGAFLGLSSMIGIYRIKVNDTDCSSCKRCEKSCDIGALSSKASRGNDSNLSDLKLNNSECIMCGECRNVCSKDCIS